MQLVMQLKLLIILMVQKAMIPLAGPANRQGRIAANNMMGKKEKYQGTLGYICCKSI